MQIQNQDHTVSGPVAQATPGRHRRIALVVAGALVLVLGTVGTVAAMAGRPSPAAKSPAPSIAVAPNGHPAAPPAAQPPAARPATTPISSAPAAPVLADGTYPTYIDQVDGDGATITVDVVQVFHDEAAVVAAIEDGMTPEEAQRYQYVYVRDENPRLRTLSIAGDVVIELLHECDSPANPDPTLTQLAEKTTPFNPLYYYDVTVANGAVQHITERLAQAAC
jgi:hypothetical protein